MTQLTDQFVADVATEAEQAYNDVIAQRFFEYADQTDEDVEEFADRVHKTY